MLLTYSKGNWGRPIHGHARRVTYQKAPTMLRHKRIAISAFLACFYCVVALAQDQHSLTPEGFSFDGAWSCEGKFPSNGATHTSKYTGRTFESGAWVELDEVDIQPKGYVGHYVWQFDKKNNQIVSIDANRSGYTVYTSPGWNGNKLTFTSTAASSSPETVSRFIFETKDADQFTVTYEMSRNMSFVPGDSLICHKAK